MAQEVTIDGVRFQSWAYRHRKAGNLSFGSVHVNRSCCAHEILVRVRGVAMFSHYTSLKGRVILEIDPDISRRVLTSNRDGLAADYRAEFDQFMEKLSADCESALSERCAPVRMDYGAPTRSLHRHSPAAPGNDAPAYSDTVQRSAVDMVCAATYSCCETTDSKDGARWGATRPELDYVVFLDSGKPAIRRRASKFSPENIIGTVHERLLTGWTTACEIALNILMDVRPLDSVHYATGFVFTNDDQAVCLSSNGTHSLLLNPLTQSAKLRFRLGRDGTSSVLLALACHEAAHIIESYHNETHTSVLTDIMSKISPRHYRKIKAALRKKRAI